MEITEYQRETIKSRFVTEVAGLEFDYFRSVVLFIGLTNLVTISGILITAFTSLNRAISLGDYWQNVLSWAVWSLSLALTLANGWLTTFGIYKKYVLDDVTLEKMYNEGWSFIGGVNRYEHLTMDERVNTFCSKIEQIITKTTIKQLSDNTAGVNVHDIMEVPMDVLAAESAKLMTPDTVITLTDNIALTDGTANAASAASAGTVSAASAASVPRRKKKNRH
jgi:hypothetical protein